MKNRKGVVYTQDHVNADDASGYVSGYSDEIEGITPLTDYNYALLRTQKIHFNEMILLPLSIYNQPRMCYYKIQCGAFALCIHNHRKAY